MHPYIAYALIALIVVCLVGALVQWRRSTSRKTERSFRYTFDETKPRL